VPPVTSEPRGVASGECNLRGVLLCCMHAGYRRRVACGRSACLSAIVRHPRSIARQTAELGGSSLLADPRDSAHSPSLVSTDPSVRRDCGRTLSRRVQAAVSTVASRHDLARRSWGDLIGASRQRPHGALIGRLGHVDSQALAPRKRLRPTRRRLERAMRGYGRSRGRAVERARPQ